MVRTSAQCPLCRCALLIPDPPPSPTTSDPIPAFSHSREIKNPLNVVVFFLSELGACTGKDYGAKRTSATPADHSRQFAHPFPDAINSVRLLAETVENCRHLAKVDSGTYAPQEEELDLRQMAESCLGVFGREREAGLVFDLHCPAELAIVSDRLLWRHVLMNLIGNAVKFTLHGGSNSMPPLATGAADAPRVTVRIERAAHSSAVRVEVLDNGPGVDIGDQAKIFGRFAQASRGFNAQGLGSGLGLHLSAKTIQMLRGELKLTSPLQPLGRGASFGGSSGDSARLLCAPRRPDMREPSYFADPPLCRFPIFCTEFLVPCKFAERLPARSTAAIVPLDVSHARALVPAELRILIVEDDELNCLVMKTSLEVGFRIVCGNKVIITITHTVEDALEVIGDTADIEFDVVVSDQHMDMVGGVLKGSELIEQLVARNFARCPVLAIASANTEEHEKTAYYASGADIVWPKPYPKNAVLAREILQTWHGSARGQAAALASSKRRGSSKVVPIIAGGR